MPSDTPPSRPSILVRRPSQAPAPSGSQPAAPAPTILNPALRRFWHRDEDVLLGSPRPEGRRRISNSFGWAAIVAMALVAAALINEGPDILEQPARDLPADSQLARVVIPPPDAPLDPELVSSFGLGGMRLSTERVETAGRAGEDAVACGRRTRAWVNDARDAMASELAEQLPSFDADRAMMKRLREHLALRFQSAQKQAADDLEQRGQKSVCDELAYSPGYSQLTQAAARAGVQTQ